jgi:DNA-binding HxlR family transcriptional regulator
MTRPRQYEDPCGVARALDRIGERWALLVVRELLLGPKRFGELRAGLPTMSPNVLTQRLDELRTLGVVERQALESPPNAWAYALTPWGRDLEPVLVALARWGSRASPVPRGELSVDALLLALRTTLDLTRATGPALIVKLRIEGASYRARLADGELRITRSAGAIDVDDSRSENGEVAATIALDATTLRRIAFGDLALAAARQDGAVQITGDVRAAARLLGSFRRPAPASVR